jgi:hypothetical protein
MDGKAHERERTKPQRSFARTGRVGPSPSIRPDGAFSEFPERGTDAGSGQVPAHCLTPAPAGC